MVLLCRNIEILPQTSSKVTPTEKDGRRCERQKTSGDRRRKAYEKKQDEKKTDAKKADEKLEKKPEEKKTDDKKQKENVMVLKIKFCCESCNLKLQKILKVKGLATVSMDMEKDLVTVKGTVSATELSSYIKAELKKDVEVLVPAKKDTVSTKEKEIENGAAIHKKDNDAGAMGMKGKEVVIRERKSKPTEEKRKGKEKDTGTAEIRHKDSEPKGSVVMDNKSENKDSSANNLAENVMVLKIKFCCESCNLKLQKILKVKGLAMVSMDMEKDLVTVKGTVSATELRSYIKAELKKDVEVVVPAKKDTVSTKEKKDNDAGAMGRKGKEVVMRERESKPTEEKRKGKEKDTGAAEIRHKDSEPKGSAVMDNKSENKDSSVNNQNKDRHRMHHPPYDHRSVDYVYDYNCRDRPVYHSNGYDMFSDENPHSYCTIL